MGAANPKLEISVAAEPASVGLARTETVRWYREHPRGDDRVAAAIALGVSEAVANVVRHAYPRGDRGRVDVDAWMDGDQVQVDVHDRGLGMTPRGSGHDERPGHAGMGLPLIGTVADAVTVVSDERGTTVSMRFDAVWAAGRASIARPALHGSYA